MGFQKRDRRKVNITLVRKGAVLSEEHQGFLERKYEADAVRQVIFGIPGGKSPGPDGFSAQFYQDCWDVIGKSVSEAVVDSLNAWKLLKVLNNTTITLIPKVICLNNVGDYRPIACCNVLYKVMIKMISERLRSILPGIIAENQGAFVKGRYVAHNVMICQDLIKFYGRKITRPGCLIKLDIKKAYDTLEWDCIEEMMKALKFPDSFVRLVIECVKIPKFSLLLSGSSKGYFGANRGLRQGDPMSPLLFVIVMEYLSRILRSLDRKEGFKFHHRCEGIKLNHLIFADDVLLFSNGDLRSVHYMMQGLELFSQTSGLMPNPLKTNVYCSRMGDREVQQVRDMTGFQVERLPFMYLGVPISPKRLIAAEGKILTEKMVYRICQWASRSLSYAGSVILINSVLMAIQAY